MVQDLPPGGQIAAPSGIGGGVGPSEQVPLGVYDAAALAAEKQKFTTTAASGMGGEPPDCGAGTGTNCPQQQGEGIGFTGLNPPDPTIAAGPSNLVLAVNSA